MTIAAYHRQTGAHVTSRARSPPGNHFFPSNQNQWSSGEGLTEFDMMTVQWAVGRLTSQSRGSITESNFLFTLWLPSHHLESHMTGLCLNDRWHQWNSLNVFTEFNMNPDSAGEVSSPCAGALYQHGFDPPHFPVWLSQLSYQNISPKKSWKWFQWVNLIIFI